MPAVREDTLTGLVVALAGIGVLVWVIPAQTSQATAFGMPPSLMPRVTMVAAVLLAGLLAILGALRAPHAPASDDERDLPDRTGLLGFLLVLVCVGLVWATGLMVGGALTIAAFMVVMGERRPIPIAVASLAGPGLIQFLLGAALRFA